MAVANVCDACGKLDAFSQLDTSVTLSAGRRVIAVVHLPKAHDVHHLCRACWADWVRSLRSKED